MKTIYNLLLITVFLFVSLRGISQPPPPPVDPSLPSSGPAGPVGGAPIGNGTYILFVLAAAYAGRKIYLIRTQPAEE